MTSSKAIRQKQDDKQAAEGTLTTLSKRATGSLRSPASYRAATAQAVTPRFMLYYPA
jgi:hypothetical protein